MKFIHTLQCALAQELSNSTSRYAIIKLFERFQLCLPACIRSLGTSVITRLKCSPAYLSHLATYPSRATTTIDHDVYDLLDRTAQRWFFSAERTLGYLQTYRHTKQPRQVTHHPPDVSHILISSLGEKKEMKYERMKSPCKKKGREEEVCRSR